MTRLLGVDYGTKRTGLAVSDGLGLTAQPLEVVATAELSSRIRAIVEELGVSKIVIGLPTGLGGHEGDSALGARALASELAASTGVEVELIDERFTSRIAEGVLLESGMKRRQRRETVDKVAAAIILQAYLDTRTSTGNSDAG